MKLFQSKRALWGMLGLFALLGAFLLYGVFAPELSPLQKGAPDLRLPSMRNVPPEGSPKLDLAPPEER